MVLVLAFAACSIEDSEYDKQVQRDDQAIEDYLNEKKIDAQKHPDGFWYEKLDASNGEVGLKEGDVVSFYYKISLLNGTLIGDLDPLTDEPAKVKLYAYSIIPVGLDDAIGMMKIGDTYRFYLPSYLSYGSYSTDKFEAYSNFIIDIKVVKAETEAAIKQAQDYTIQNYLSLIEAPFEKQETGLFYIPITEGTGDRPNNVSRITFDFRGII
jgi:FKBP-type peptidyl-prolyl cis-trans isomerase